MINVLYLIVKNLRIISSKITSRMQMHSFILVLPIVIVTMINNILIL